MELAVKRPKVGDTGEVHLLDLPEEILVRILREAGLEGRRRLSKTCRRLRDVAGLFETYPRILNETARRDVLGDLGDFLAKATEFALTDFGALPWSGLNVGGDPSSECYPWIDNPVEKLTAGFQRTHLLWADVQSKKPFQEAIAGAPVVALDNTRSTQITAPDVPAALCLRLNGPLIPPAVFDSVVRLEISYNKRLEEIDALPASVEVLILSDTKIRRLPARLPNLRKLDVELSPLSNMPEMPVLEDLRYRAMAQPWDPKSLVDHARFYEIVERSRGGVPVWPVRVGRTIRFDLPIWKVPRSVQKLDLTHVKVGVDVRHVRDLTLRYCVLREETGVEHVLEDSTTLDATRARNVFLRGAPYIEELRVSRTAKRLDVQDCTSLKRVVVVDPPAASTTPEAAPEATPLTADFVRFDGCTDMRVMPDIEGANHVVLKGMPRLDLSKFVSMPDHAHVCVRGVQVEGKYHHGGVDVTQTRLWVKK